ncbi:hypothetical protein [Almyronema epifaneia]|uniref:PEP-CTERM sorting domain-containing protein n=1 Tax=Almyronema epifaneia S1 TaxID=2991925 RepID=A0ABW6IID2_9CYAN
MQVSRSSSRFLGGTVLLSLAIACPGYAASVVLNTDLGEIGTVDPALGDFSSTFVGSRFNDVALSQSGKIVGVTADQQLYQIEGKTATAIGSLGLAASVLVTGLSFDSQDRLYALGLDTQSQTGQVYQVSPVTGLATAVVAGLAVGIYGDLVFDADRNRFWAIRQENVTSPTSILFSLTPSGAAADIGSVGFAAITGLAISNGALYGYTQQGEQVLINPFTGVGTFDLALKSPSGGDRQFLGAASAPIPYSTVPQTPPVPEPSFWLAAIAAGSLGTLMRRCQQRSQR